MMAEQHRPQSREALKRRTARHGSGRIDGDGPVTRPPGAGGVKILECKAQRIYLRMARCAGRILPVLLQPFAPRGRLAASTLIRKARHVGGWRGRGCAKESIEHPFAAQHWRRPIGIRRHCQQTAVGQQASSLLRIAERHSPEAGPIDVRYPIVTGQPLVEEAVVGPQQFLHASILAQLTLDEQLRLPRQRFTQVVVKFRKQIRIRSNVPYRAQLQPLAEEIVHQRCGARVGQQAPHLLRQNDRIMKRPSDGYVEEFIIGNAAPEKERQPGGQFEAAQGIGASGGNTLWIAFNTKQESRVNEDSFERELDAGIEATLAPADSEKVEQRLNVSRRDRPAIRTPRERRKNIPGAAFLVCATRWPTYEDSSAAGCVPGARDSVRPFYYDGVHSRITVRHLNTVSPHDRRMCR